MSRTVKDSRQVVQRGTRLDQIADKTDYDSTTDAKPASTTELDNLLDGINSELIPPLRMAESQPNDLILNIGAIDQSNTQTGRNSTIQPIGGVMPTFAGGTVTFPASSGGTITTSIGNSIVITLTIDYYMKIGISLLSNGELFLIAGTQGISIAAATNPPTINGALAIGHVVILNNSGTIDNISASSIYQYKTSYARVFLSLNGEDIMSLAYKLIANIAISTINTDLTMYTVPADSRVVGQIIISNQSSVNNRIFRLALVPNGETLGAKHHIYYDASLTPHEILVIQGLTLGDGDKIVIRTDTDSATPGTGIVATLMGELDNLVV